MTGSKISSSSAKLVYFGLIRKTRWPPWPIRKKGDTLYSGARYMALWAPCFILDLFIMLHIVEGNCLYYVNLAPDTFSLTMKYNIHFGWYIDTYISLHILFIFLLPLGFFLANPEQDLKEATRRPWSVRTLFAFLTFFFILVDSSTLPKRGLGRYS